MKKKNLLISAMAGAVLVAACGGNNTGSVTGPSLPTGGIGNTVVTTSGSVITQERSVSGFTGVTIGVPGRLTIERGDGASSLMIIGDENALAVITSDVRDGELTIGLTANTDLRLNDVTEIEYRVRVEALRRLEVNGVVHAVANGIATSQFDVRINGSSTVTVSGTAERQNVNASGTSRYEARELVSRDAVVDVSGAAFVLLDVRDTLRGQVTGAAVVRYVGSPEVSVTVSGSGSVGPQ